MIAAPGIHQTVEILQDERVGHGSVFHVNLGIEVLEVVEKQVGHRDGFLQHIPIHLPAGFHGGVDVALVAAGCSNFQAEIGLVEGLTSGEGHPAAGFAVEGGIFEDLLENFF